MRNKKRHIFTLLLASSLANVSYAKDESLKFSVGFDYSSGDYGLSTDTDILYLPFSMKYEKFPWSFKATIPYVKISSPEGVVAGTDGVVIIGDSNTQRTEEGLGDIILASSFALDSLLNTHTLIDLKAKVKLATADENKGLGTGKNDYSLQLDLAKKYGKTTPFATIGYKVTGDPENTELKDIWYGSLGFDQKITSRFNAGFSYDVKEATSSNVDSSQETMLYLNWKLTKKISILGYGIIGLSDNSPDSAIGIQTSIKE